jgi:hypothetical protein
MLALLLLGGGFGGSRWIIKGARRFALAMGSCWWRRRAGSGVASDVSKS